MYRKSPHTLATKPEVPDSGHLVLTDEEADAQDSLCWGSCGICKRKKVKKLPFPQDKILSVVYTSEYQETTTTKVWFLPVPNQPLSSNCYYVIRAKGRHKGYVYIYILYDFHLVLILDGFSLLLSFFPTRTIIFLACYVAAKHAQAQEKEIS